MTRDSFHISCVLVGHPDAGVSTLMKVFGGPSDESTTRSIRVYQASDTDQRIDTKHCVNHHSDAIHTFTHPIRLIPELQTAIPLRFIHYPSFDESAESAAYELHLQNLAPTVHMYCIVVDIHDAGKPTIEHVLTTTLDTIACNGKDGPIRLLVLVNKCEMKYTDPALLGYADDADAADVLVFDRPQLAAMYDSIVEQVCRSCDGIHDLGYRVCPISAANAFVYRMKHAGQEHLLSADEIGRLDKLLEQDDSLDESYERHIEQCGFTSMMQAFRDFLEPTCVHSWVTAHVNTQARAILGHCKPLSDVEFITNRLELIRIKIIQPLDSLYKWYQAYDGCNDSILAPWITSLCGWMTQQFYLDEHFKRFFDMESLLGQTAEWFVFVRDVRETLQRATEMASDTCIPAVAKALIGIQTTLRDSLYQRASETIQTHVWSLLWLHKDMGANQLVESVLQSIQLIKDLYPDDCSVWNAPIETMLTKSIELHPHLVNGQWMSHMWFELARLGIAKPLLLQWIRRYLMDKNAYVQDAVESPLYHVAMETALRRMQAHDTDLCNYLHELEVRTKMLNVYYGRDCGQYTDIICASDTASMKHLAMGETTTYAHTRYSVPMFELDCLIQLYTKSMTPATHRDTPLRRSSRKRKRVHKMDL